VVIPPTLLLRDGAPTDAARDVLARLAGEDASGAGPDAWQSAPELADFAAQVSAARAGVAGVRRLTAALGGVDALARGIAALDEYAERLAQDLLGGLPEGRWCAEDVLDDDGQGTGPVRIAVTLTIAREAGATRVDVDFTGTDAAVAGNVNAPLSVAAAAVLYVFRCLMPAATPASAGAFRPIRIHAPAGSLLDAGRPAAVAAGNVETSMRVVDVLLRALAPVLPERIPAAAQGTMNNVAMGARGVRRWDYYETLAGGLGGSSRGPGPSAVHAHMTNTLNTPIESLESHYPLRIERYALRRGSGGAGRHAGGDGVERAYRFLEDAEVTLIGDRRRIAPWGLAGGGDGTPGADDLDGETLPGKVRRQVRAGQVLTVRTPGGGGWGES
jgi:N-methylhydantoinase B